MFGIFLQAAKLYTSKQAHEVYVIVTRYERAAINSGSIIKEFVCVCVYKFYSCFLWNNCLFYHFLIKLSDFSLFLRYFLLVFGKI